MKTKGFSIRTDGATWQLTRATLWLSDAVSHGQYNSPRMALTFQGSQPNASLRTVNIEWQRNLEAQGTETPKDYTHTRLDWSASYGGHVELRDCDRFEVRDRPFELPLKAKFAVEVARRLARYIAEKNLWAVYRNDECAQVCAAVQELTGGLLERLYVKDGGQEIPMRDARAEWAQANVGEKVAL